MPLLEVGQSYQFQNIQDHPWMVWKAGYGNAPLTATTIGAPTQQTWGWWNEANITSTGANEWVVWNAPYTTCIASPVNAAIAPPLTPEEIEQQEQRRREAEHQWLDREKERARAGKRAERLLFSLLTKEQRSDYRLLRHFHLLVGEKRYRIWRGASGNVRLLRDDQEVESYCIHPPSPDLPVEDTMAAQVLMLQTDEERFLRTANRQVLRCTA